MSIAHKIIYYIAFEFNVEYTLTSHILGTRKGVHFLFAFRDALMPCGIDSKRYHFYFGSYCHESIT